MLRFLAVAMLRTVLLGPLYIVIFFGDVADEVYREVNKRLPWMIKETPEQRRIRLL